MMLAAVQRPTFAGTGLDLADPCVPAEAAGTGREPHAGHAQVVWG